MQLTLLSDPSRLLADDREVVRVACEGTIRHADFDRASEPLRVLLGPFIFRRQVLLNLEKATSIDSSGISWLLMCHKQFAEAKGRLILYAVPPLVLQVLQLVRLPTLIPVVPDEAAARNLALGQKP